jgi:hypothetical protein
MIKNFARLIVQRQLDDSEVESYFEVVDEIVPTKTVWAHSDGETGEVEVIIYQDEDEFWIYEVILSEDIDGVEGEEIAEHLEDVLDDDFEFEISADVETGAGCES